jgi:hypothetical protein
MTVAAPDGAGRWWRTRQATAEQKFRYLRGVYLRSAPWLVVFIALALWSDQHFFEGVVVCCGAFWLLAFVTLHLQFRRLRRASTGSSSAPPD